MTTDEPTGPFSTRSNRRPTRLGERWQLPIAVVLVATFVAIPAGLLAIPGASVPASGAPRAPSFHATGSAGAFAAPREPLAHLATTNGATNFPSPLSASPSGLLGAMDLIHNQFVPGASAHTFNGIAPTTSAYDPDNHLLYVTASASNAVLVVNTTTRASVGSIPVGSYPYGVAFDPAGHEVFVANLLSNNVSVINDTTNTAIGQISIPSGVTGIPSAPASVLYDPLNKTVLVGQYGSFSGYLCCTDNITVIDGKTNQIVQELPAPANVVDLAYNAQNHLLYALGSSAGVVGVTDLSTNTPAGNWLLHPAYGLSPTGIAVDPIDGLVYVASTTFGSSATLTEISAASGTIVKNITLVEPGAFFGYVTPRYSNTTGKVYVSTEAGDLFVVTAATGTYVSGNLDGTCVEPLTLAPDGAPFVASDSCAYALAWLDQTTGVLAHTSTVGDSPTAVLQIPSSGALAVIEPYQQRIDLVDPISLTVNSQMPIAPQYGYAAVGSTTDTRTGWLYLYDQTPTFPSGGTTGPVVAFDTAGNAVRWSWNPCANCYLDGIAASNGTLFVLVLNSTSLSDQLYEVNATTGAVRGHQTVAPYPFGSNATSLPQASVVPVNGTSLVVVADIRTAAVVAINTTTGARAWTRPTGAGTGPLAFLSGSGLIAMGAGNGSLEQVEFVTGTTGGWVTSEALPGVATSVAPGATSTEAYVLAGGDLIRVDASQPSAPVNITLPSGADPAGLFYLGISGGIALPSPTLGEFYWLGAAVNVTRFASVGATGQGESLFLNATISGGFGPRTISYTGLPAGCPSANATPLTCLPLSSGPATITLRASDATGLPNATATIIVDLAKYPLVANISAAATFFLPNEQGTFAAQLGAGEAGIGPFLSYNWTLVPASAGTLNRTNASTVSVLWTQPGPAALVLTTDLRGTVYVAQVNVSVIASSTSTFLGLSGTGTLLLVAVVVALIVAVVAVLVVRSRRAPPPPAAETVDDAPAAPDDAVQPESASADVPMPEAPPPE